MTAFRIYFELKLGLYIECGYSTIFSLSCGFRDTIISHDTIFKESLLHYWLISKILINMQKQSFKKRITSILSLRIPISSYNGKIGTI